MNDKYFIEELRQKREQDVYKRQVINGKFVENIETTEIRYFSLQDLPHNLAEEKTNKEQIEMCFKAYLNENWQTQFD